MRIRFRPSFLALALLSTARLSAQPPVPADDPSFDGTAPLPGETIFLPALKGLITVPDEKSLAAPPPAGFTGVDTSRTPLLADPAIQNLIRTFLDKPMSFGSLDRLCIGVRTYLRLRGQPFVSVSAPPQEVTGGVIRLVVQRAALDGELQIEGTPRRPAEFYRAAVPLAAGAEIDAAAVQAGVDRLNRSPLRRVTVVAEPGAQAGTTKLVLRVQETKPWQVNLGYNNAGTPVTDENRVSAGWSWGDAFGRGDSLGYNVSADPGLDHSRSHSANYGTTFASGRSLTVFGSYSTIESALPAPLTQEGTSWQAGLRFGVPLAKTTGGWERALSFATDFKYSDNTLEFAAIPITDNATHVAQVGAILSFTRRGETRTLAWSASAYASPGGLTSRNDDAAFDGSRAGARAAYAYGRIEGQFAQRLPQGFSVSIAGAVQAASSALIGTEQLVGGGSAGVRGFRESTAFGDDGVLVNTELHLPAFSPLKGRDQADPFAFVDAAALRTRGPGGNRTELSAAGAGLNYRWGRTFSLRAAYGWVMKDLSEVETPSGHGHLAATLSF